MKTKVSLLREGKHVSETVEELLHLLGNPLDELQPGMKVLIKPNMFQVKPGFHSNPEIICTLARLAFEKGAKVTVSERTRNIYTILKDSEIHRYAEVVSLDDVPLRVAPINEATSLRVPLAFPEIVLDCDYFIGVPQLRTHAGVLVTNAMKNLVGLLPGFTTRVVHMAGVEESVVDLNILRHQHLLVCDATTVIEGNYPMEGEATRVGIVSASTNAVAIDTVMSTVSGYDPLEVEYLRDAHERGMGPIAMNEIEVLGALPSDVAFQMKRAPSAPVSPKETIKIHADSACVQCQRYIAGALEKLTSELDEYQGELTILSGPMDSLPELHGQVVLVGNCTYQHRQAGIYIEGCPPRAIQLAAFKYALGQEVTEDQRTQFRVPHGG
ncbi:DUF362 domain-containing protein [Brevibacillus ruminantium]|uniref:DUF362 domain-containing protein n=1 Tax=Brevibacillus ruminantium TaxID=2950604 RepID=A0ABY4WBP6_9BACL|nr:DUF362 domain-containing protein [Brevibacillus ruminantium]USG64610.1 DUF362 domain-containing protein [Brevibacillus ruminantium]